MSTNNPSIKSIGNDIVEVDRIEKAIDRHGHHLIGKIFTIKEQDYCLKYSKPAERYAGRFAAKEAIAKALGTGIGTSVSWHDIEISNDSNGKPIVLLSNKVKTEFNNPTIIISISHTAKYATAVALWI